MASNTLLWVKALKSRQRELERILKLIDRELPKLPEGKLRVTSAGGKPRYYLIKGNPKTQKDLYLGVNQKELIKKLARKRYLEQLRTSALAELSAIEAALKKLPDRPPEEVHASLFPGLQAVVEPLVLSDDQYEEAWLAEMQLSASGDKFKSRIERIIHQTYDKLGLAHVYEPALYLEGYGTARPDFAVLDPRTRETFYHEHFGMMDDDEYRHKNLHKLSCYHQNGYIEGINLIVTMEGGANPIDPDEIEDMLKVYFKMS